ncbi:MAG: hypothetical protein U9Q81_05310 [Pseudomonadota bacterium]|nr:hypothetical protein [Pseudomonadota bacterium]
MLTLSTHTAIDDLSAEAWNRLVGADPPFLRHAFLAALERFLGLEREGMEDYLAEMHTHSPFKAESPPASGPDAFPA